MKIKNFKIKNASVVDYSYMAEASKVVNKLNKDLQDDVYSNRFKYKIKKYEYNKLDPYCSFFLVEFIDSEEPERNKEEWYEYSGLIYIGFGGLKNIWKTMNDFIIYSDFWKKWDNDYYYAQNHWYSNDQLKYMVDNCGKEWTSPETLAKAKPNRWPNNPYKKKEE